MLEFFFHNSSYFLLFYLLLLSFYLFFNEKKILLKYKILFVSICFSFLSIIFIFILNNLNINKDKLNNVILIDNIINLNKNEYNDTYLDFSLKERINYFYYLTEDEQIYLKKYFNYIYSDSKLTYIEYYNFNSRLFYYTNIFFNKEFIKNERIK